MSSKSVIELNGQRYDAISGLLLSTEPAEIKRPVVSAKSQLADANRSVDGVFAGSSQATIVPAAKSIHITVMGSQTERPAAKHVQPHKPVGAKTLMRSAVKRPEPSLKNQTTVQGELQPKAPGVIATKLSVNNVSPHRLQRAHSVARSQHISHYHDQHHSVPVNVAPLHVQNEPVNPANNGAPAPVPNNKPVDIFEHAIANAANFVDVKAHRAHFKKKTRQHILSMSAGILALVVVGGFAFYLNSPGVQFKVASVHAGVATNMPNLKAAGFAFNGIKSDKSGELTVGFKGSSGTYQLMQQATNWSAEDMIQNIGSTDASGYPIYQTIQAGDTPVYRFSNSTATWVKHGMWYQVNGTGALSNDQVKTLVQNT